MASLIRQFFSSAFKMSETKPMNLPAGANLVTVAAGCFWGVEHMYRKEFGNGKGLIDARVGYIGGKSSSPSYQAVCSGSTGHAEALQVHFDPEKVTYRQLIEYFYRMHDPTTLNSQGPDRGSQYRSGIFYHSDEQKKIAEDVTSKAQAQWYKDSKIETQIVEAGQWWDAEAYHQVCFFFFLNLLGHLVANNCIALSRCESRGIRMPKSLPSHIPCIDLI